MGNKHVDGMRILDQKILCIFFKESFTEIVGRKWRISDFCYFWENVEIQSFFGSLESEYYSKLCFCKLFEYFWCFWRGREDRSNLFSYIEMDLKDPLHFFLASLGRNFDIKLPICMGLPGNVKNFCFWALCVGLTIIYDVKRTRFDLFEFHRNTVG